MAPTPDELAWMPVRLSPGLIIPDNRATVEQLANLSNRRQFRSWGSDRPQV